MYEYSITNIKKAHLVYEGKAQFAKRSMWQSRDAIERTEWPQQDCTGTKKTQNAHQTLVGGNPTLHNMYGYTLCMYSYT